MRTILVVDDEEGIHKIIKRVFEEHYNIISIDNIGEIEKQIEKNPIDLLLLDVWLKGGGNTIGYLSEFKTKYKNIPVIVMSAFDYGETVISTIDNGAHSFVSKPFDISELKCKVLRVFDKAVDLEIKRDAGNKYWDILKNAKNHLKENYANKITIEETAKRFDTNPELLNALFREWLGFSAKEYLNCCRMQEAFVLLTETKIPIKKIYKLVGISSNKTFVEAIKNHFYKKPLQLRSEAKPKITLLLPSKV